MARGWLIGGAALLAMIAGAALLLDSGPGADWKPPPRPPRRAVAEPAAEGARARDAAPASGPALDPTASMVAVAGASDDPESAAIHPADALAPTVLVRVVERSGHHPVAGAELLAFEGASAGVCAFDDPPPWEGAPRRARRATTDAGGQARIRATRGTVILARAPPLRGSFLCADVPEESIQIAVEAPLQVRARVRDPADRPVAGCAVELSIAGQKSVAPVTARTGAGGEATGEIFGAFRGAIGSDPLHIVARVVGFSADRAVLVRPVGEALAVGFDFVVRTARLRLELLDVDGETRYRGDAWCTVRCRFDGGQPQSRPTVRFRGGAGAVDVPAGFRLSVVLQADGRDTVEEDVDALDAGGEGQAQIVVGAEVFRAALVVLDPAGERLRDRWLRVFHAPKGVAAPPATASLVRTDSEGGLLLPIDAEAYSAGGGMRLELLEWDRQVVAIGALAVPYDGPQEGVAPELRLADAPVAAAGRVLDEGGRAVAGALVRGRSVDAKAATAGACDPSGLSHAHARTDERGRFVLRGATESCFRALDVGAPGFQSVAWPLDPRALDLKNLAIPLRRAR